MMILAALLAFQGLSGAALTPAPKKPAAVPSAPKAAPDTVPDIATLDKKLAGWKGRWGYHDDKFVCETRTSSGDSAVDAVGCRALVTCLGPEGQRLNAIAQGAGTDKDRADEIQAIVSKAAPCVADKRHQGLVALAQLRGYKEGIK